MPENIGKLWEKTALEKIVTVGDLEENERKDDVAREAGLEEDRVKDDMEDRGREVERAEGVQVVIVLIEEAQNIEEVDAVRGGL